MATGGFLCMDKRREIIGMAMADFLEIPRDLVLDLPKITVIGMSELYLENHRGIIEYSSNRMRINLIRGYLEIEGDGLEIKALLPEEMKVTGNIVNLRYLE